MISKTGFLYFNTGEGSKQLANTSHSKARAPSAISKNNPSRDRYVVWLVKFDRENEEAEFMKAHTHRSFDYMLVHRKEEN